MLLKSPDPISSDRPGKYISYPNPALLATRLEIRNHTLYWRKKLAFCSDQELEEALEIPQSMAGRPAASTPQFAWFGSRYQTPAITWAVAYGRYPTYRLVLRKGPGSASNDLRNLMQVVPARLGASPAYVEYFFHQGMVGAQVVPKLPSGATVQEVSREVHYRIFPDISSASAWAEQKKDELFQVAVSWRNPGFMDTKRRKPSQKPTRYVTLPDFEEDFTRATSVDIADLQLSTAPLPALSILSLDMLSYRACERFVGLAVNFSRENDGFLPDLKTPGSLLTVRLGAVDGVWEVATDLQNLSKPPMRHTRSSQEAALAAYSVSAQVRVGRTPGGAPRALRKALLNAYREIPPTTEERRTALALLTPATIPVLGQSLSKKRAPIKLVPDNLPESAPHVPLPLFLAELLGKLDLRQYYPTNATFNRQKGLLLVVQRTTKGFLFRLHGRPSGPSVTDGTKMITQKLYPSRVGRAAFRKIRAKTIYRGVVTSVESITRLAPNLANLITDRLSQEHGWTVVKERKEQQNRKKIGHTLQVRQYVSEKAKHTLKVLIDGEEMLLTEALKKYHSVVSYHTARDRLVRGGWTAKDAVRTPARRRNPNRTTEQPPPPQGPSRP